MISFLSQSKEQIGVLCEKSFEERVNNKWKKEYQLQENQVNQLVMLPRLFWITRRKKQDFCFSVKVLFIQLINRVSSAGVYFYFSGGGWNGSNGKLFITLDLYCVSCLAAIIHLSFQARASCSTAMVCRSACSFRMAHFTCDSSRASTLFICSRSYIFVIIEICKYFPCF